MSECVKHAAPEPVFAEPWHAQVFAITVVMNEAGRFDWSDWATRFSAVLKRRGLGKELDGGEDYFNAWLETLETFLADQGAAMPDEVHALQRDWEEAYLTTPHGKPVHLKHP